MTDQYTENYPITRIYKNGTVSTSDCLVAKEGSIELLINGIRAASILTSPADIKELAIGYAICEGIVQPDEIESVEVNDMEVDIRISSIDEFEMWSELRSSGCVGVKWQVNEHVEVTSDATFTPEAIFSGMEYLESDVYRLTKGTHLAALITKEGKLAARAIDIGRHNAIDKVVGHATMQGLDISKMYLLSTGRQSAGMVLKAARAGIPLIVTKSSAFDSGIEAAKRTGVGLVGFASKAKITVFANKWRIKIE